MADIKRLAEAWELFRRSNPYEICDGIEFRAFVEPEYCMGQMINDTLTLLKEHEAREQCLKTKCVICPHCEHCDVDENGLLKKQEAVEPIRMHHTEHKQTDNYRCQKCGNDLYFEQRFCEACGQEVKWDA